MTTTSKNIGIILPHLIPSQLLFEVTNIINANANKHSYCIFYENISPTFNSVLCPVMNISEMKYFRKGRLIGFTLGSGEQMLKSVNHIEPLLYLYDLEWLRGKTDYVRNLSILRQIPLATRSEEYSKLAENYTNTKCPFKKLEEILCP